MAETGEPEERGTTAPSEPPEAEPAPDPAPAAARKKRPAKAPAKKPAEAEAEKEPATEAEAEPTAEVKPTVEPATAEAEPTAEVEPATADTEPTAKVKPAAEPAAENEAAAPVDAEDDPEPAAEAKPEPATDPQPTAEVKAEPDGGTGTPEWPPPAASTSGNTVTTQARPQTLDDLAPLPTSPAPTSAGAAALEAVPPVEAPAEVGRLATALSQLRATIGGTAYPLVMPSADEAKRVGDALVSQLDDYLLPRLARLDAPLLVVVGGSTGAGKSTLVNSLVRAPVSAAGVLRPTTRSPVLVSHPSDSSWFRKGELLPGLTRTAESSTDPRTLQLVAAPALGPGLAFLDAPDIDSVVDRNRQLAAQLLAAADLWLFVTTAARYADAVPWELLKTARLRGTVIALVLDRVPADAAGEISAHLAEMLTEHDMGAAPLFVLPETTLDRQGLLPEDVTAQLHDWFAQLAADASARAAVVRQTLDGALTALGPAVEGLAAAADEQAVAAKALDERVTAAYRTARRTMENGLQDGRLLRGEVLARWQEFVGTGEFLRTLESRVGQLRDKVVAAITGRPAPGRNLQVALESQLVTLLRGVAADAAEQAYAAWQAHPAGTGLLEPSLQKPSPDLPEQAERVVRDWQQWVLDLVRQEAGDKRIVARGAAYAVNGVGLAVMIAVFTSTAFIPTGAEVAVGAGTTVAAQKVLEAVFGDQAIRTLAARSREELLARVNVLLDKEAARYTDRTAAVGLELEPGATLRQAAADVERAREELALTGTPS
ncbi:dynamin family protein [Couchioplanes caeruleus]|uniref:dynamin family protein n=1 Tax=Couchioplanes caeruleus TaxID=56438 RepID=UPI003D318AFB